MKYVVRLEKVREVTTTSTGKDIARIEVTELSLNKRYPVTVWLNKKEFVFKVGDSLEMDIKRREDNKGEPILYRGSEQFSCNLESIVPIKATFPPEEKTAPEIKDIPKGEKWEVNFNRYKQLIEIYTPINAGDLKEIAKMAGFSI